MIDRLPPAGRAVVLFVIGCLLVLAAELVTMLIRQGAYAIDWLHVLEGGVLVTVLSFIFPSEKRKKNREKRKDSFKK